MTPAISSPPNSAPGSCAAGPGLLGDVHRVLEADEREERRPAPPMIASGTDSSPLNSSARDGSPSPPNSAAAPMTTTSSRPVSSMSVSPTLSFDALADAAEVDERHDRDEHESDERGRQRRRTPRGSRRRTRGERRRGGQARAHHREGDQERDERAAERLVDVERRARRLRVLRHELGVRERGESARSSGERNAAQIAPPTRPPTSPPARRSRAQDVADDEEEQHPARDAARLRPGPVGGRPG